MKSRIIEVVPFIPLTVLITGDRTEKNSIAKKGAALRKKLKKIPAVTHIYRSRRALVGNTYYYKLSFECILEEAKKIKKMIKKELEGNE